MQMSVSTEAKGPDTRAEALVASYERAGYARIAPAILQPAEPFLDLSGEDIRKRMYLTIDARRRRILPAPRPHHSGVARLSRLAAGRQAGGLLLSRAGVPSPQRRAGRIPAGRHRILRPADKAAADAEMLALGLEATAHYGLASPDIQIGDVALFTGLIAGLDLPPAWKRRLIKDFNRKSNLAQDLDRLVLGGNNSRPGISGRAGGARRLRSARRARAGHRSAVDRRHQRGRRPLGRRDRGALPRTVGARRQRQAAARRARADRALPDDCRRSRRGRGGAARARRRSQHDANAGAGYRPVRNPHRLFGRARHRPEARALLHRLRPRLRLLHRLRVRTDRPQAHRRSAGRRRPLRRAVHPARFAEPIAAVGFAVWIERLAVYGGAA